MDHHVRHLVFGLFPENIFYVIKHISVEKTSKMNTNSFLEYTWMFKDYLSQIFKCFIFLYQWSEKILENNAMFPQAAVFRIPDFFICLEDTAIFSRF